MKVSGSTLQKRIKRETDKYKDNVLFHKECQKKIDFITSLEWLQNHSCKLKHEVSTLFQSELTIHISNILIDDFIENVLGPFHLAFNILWKLEISGDENDPVFIYYPSDQEWSWNRHIEFRVKEGEFKVCKIVKDFVKYTEPSPPQAIYNTRLVCE